MESARVEKLEVAAYVVPTESAESDGTLEWDATTLVTVELAAGGTRGFGYTYADTATARLIEDRLAELVIGRDPMRTAEIWTSLIASIRNLGRPGIASMAIAAIDVALWDLKARLLGVPLVTLLGPCRDQVPVYGSGGFTSYSVDRLRAQLAQWVKDGIHSVKMKVGREPEKDAARVRAVRAAIGDDAELFVDANGAYSRKQALALAESFAEERVCWFEEPVSSDDLDGLRLLCDRAPSGMEITAGEYGYDLVYFRRMLEAGAVDVLQADATRCAGMTGFLKVGALCESFGVPLSSHTAPSLHLPACVALGVVRHAEYFYDHARIEQLLFDGAAVPRDGMIASDLSRPGLGIELRRTDAARYLATF